MISPADVLSARILIVDDQRANVLLLEAMLRAGGYNAVTSTMDPTTVVELHRAHRYHLILLDLQMPRMDGFAVMQALKAVETEGYLPVLVLTADPAQKVRALNAGAKDFLGKPLDLAEVRIRVHNMIEVRLLHLETKKLYEQVLVEKKMSERLLLNVLPPTIAERLKDNLADGISGVIADSFSDVTVLFADIVGFTQFSKDVSPYVLVEVLNDIFTRFDVIADARGLEKIKTIGDAYMAVAGLPVTVTDHVARAANMALDMMDAVERYNQTNVHQIKVRIGLSTGAVVAGVIGKRKFLYDVWGDTVNLAARMESQGVSGRIQMTEHTRAKLSETFATEERGPVDIKGKGEMTTWFLMGRHDRPPAS